MLPARTVMTFGGIESQGREKESGTAFRAAEIDRGSTMAKPKIVLFDLETTNLSASFGYVLCMGWKTLGQKKVHIIKIDGFDLFESDPTNDREVVLAARDVLTDADGWVGWYSSKFDEPYLNSRLVYHSLDPLPHMGMAHMDAWKIAKYRMRLNSNRLASVAAFLGLEEKTPVAGPQWIRAMAGQPSALKYVYDHCRQDIVVLEQAYEKIKVLSTSHINMALPEHKLEACPICGEVGGLQKRGWNYAKVSRKQRFQCQSCGAWSSGPSQRVKGIEAR